MSLVFLFGGPATMLGGGVSSVANLCLRFFFAATVMNLHLHDFSSTDIV